MTQVRKNDAEEMPARLQVTLSLFIWLML